MSAEQKEVVGIVTAYYPSEGENDPYNVYVDSEDGKFSTFTAETADPIEEGVKVAFVAVQNKGHWNIKDGTVDVVDTDPDITEPETEADAGGSEVFESPRARSIRCNVALKQARELCQPMLTEDVSEARFEEIRATVLETADVFAEKLAELNQQAGGDA
ncbi:hypothetical protein [Halorarum salinum]|uniref:Uncharacterized protein n=1 Tax=Halorarum salinum TaxID=2743089 RepID=A0A7D5QDF7_9EURY|nr:hypothetical protein [Halobaculum salinum]QLG62061.1 hypothetical protein HUG12_10110 [Halobaculum salinum]